MEMKYAVKCPWCFKSEVQSDERSTGHQRYICWKCHRPFIVDWIALTATKSKKERIK